MQLTQIDTHTHVCAYEMASDAAHAYFGEHGVVMAAGAGWSNKEALLGTWVAANVQCTYALKIISVASQH